MRKFLNKLSQKIKEFRLKSNKKSQIALAGILALVMLIIFINGIKSNNTKSQTSSKEKDELLGETTASLTYQQELEQRLERILASINGIGEVKAFVMTEVSVEKVYAGNEEVKISGENSSTIKNQTSEIVFEKNGTTSTPIVKLEIYPEITGVLIVAEGANDEKLRLLVINAIAVALSIENSKIEVLPG